GLLSWMFLRLTLLHYSQGSTFRRADGMIFLTDYARSEIQWAIGTLRQPVAVIPHGIAERFRQAPKLQQPLSAYSAANPFRLLYVSIVDVYKHQWQVVTALSELRRAGLPMTLDLVGPAYPPAMNRLQRVLDTVDPDGDFIHYRGSIESSKLHEVYH